MCVCTKKNTHVQLSRISLNDSGGPKKKGTSLTLKLLEASFRRRISFLEIYLTHPSPPASVLPAEDPSLSNLPIRTCCRLHTVPRTSAAARSNLSSQKSNGQDYVNSPTSAAPDRPLRTHTVSLERQQNRPDRLERKIGTSVDNAEVLGKGVSSAKVP